jgi:alpha-ketoglutarate-dependent taurine dioxygenase
MLQSPIASSRAWQAGDLARVAWRYTIPAEALDELRAVVRRLRREPMPLEQLKPAMFELAQCAGLMRRVKAMLDEGAGFAVLDRLPAEEFSEEELTAVYWLLSSLLARPVAQNRAGARMYKVQDTGRKALPGSGVRPDQTNMEQNFHNDNSYNRTQPDYIGLLCVRPALTGGESSILSISSAHNRLLQEDEDLLARLYEPFWTDRQKEHPEGDAPMIHEPVFTYDGRLKARIGLVPIVNGYAMRGEAMDERGVSALAALKRVFQRPELSFGFAMESGQMQFVDNLGICHRRTGFTDAEEPERKRLLMRIWLRDGGDVGYDG